MPLFDTFYDDALHSAWARVLRLWRPMLAWTLLVWAAAAVLLVPLTSAVVGWHLSRGDQLVVGNEELASWILSPVGASFLLLVGALALVGAVVRFAGLFQIVTNDLEGRPATLPQIALPLARRLPSLLRLSAAAVVLGALLLVPLLLGLGAVYLALLGEHDINYYLAIQPAEWRWALRIGGGWAALWGCTTVYLIARVVLAVPAFLDGHTPLPAALRRAWGLSQVRAGRFARLLVFAAGGWFVARAALDMAFLALSAFLMGWVAGVSTSLLPLLTVSAAYLAGSFLLDAAIGFFGFSFLSTLITKFYYEDTRLHAAAPPATRLAELPARSLEAARRRLRPARVIPVAVLFLAGSALAGGLILELLPEPRPVEIHAHRGGPPSQPENSLAALEESIDAGAEYSEIDIQLTSDGVAVLLHDLDLMRVAGDPRRIAEVTFEEVEGLPLRTTVEGRDAARGVGGAPGAREAAEVGSEEGGVTGRGTLAADRTLATLADALERARGRIGLSIELKYYGWDPALASEAVRLVREAGMEDEVVFMSLSLPAVRQLRELAPEIPVGYLSAVSIGQLTRLPADFLAVAAPRVRPGFVRAAHAAGMGVQVWTVNDAAQVARFIEMGVDAIITDDPELAVRVRSELAELPAAARLLLRLTGRVGEGTAEAVP